MGIFQSAVILFYVSIAAKDSGADIPIYPHDLIHPPQESQSVEINHVDTIHVAENHSTEPQDSHASGATHVNKAHDDHHLIADKVDPDAFNNPLPHVLMLTAIVVGVATLGVALSLIQRIYRLYGSIEENEVLAAIAKDSCNDLTIKPTLTTNHEKSGSHA